MSRNRPSRVVPRVRASAGEADRASASKRAKGVGNRFVLAGVGCCVLALAAWLAWGPPGSSSKDPRKEAERELADGNWLRAAELLQAYNRSHRADPRRLAEEAKAWLASDRAKSAGLAVDRALEQSPSEATAWLVKLEISRLLDRTREALVVGEAALAAVDPQEKPKVLRAVTIVALEPYPEDLARERLSAWLKHEPDDVNAKVALLAIMASAPMAGDRPRDERIAELSNILTRDPKNIHAREALVVEFAGAGEAQRGREVLDAWPLDQRDGLFHRQQGRWQLDYEHEPGKAVESLGKALETWPHDWRTWYRLSRAWKALGDSKKAAAAAKRVQTLRELLDAERLGPRLSDDLEHSDEPVRPARLGGALRKGRAHELGRVLAARIAYRRGANTIDRNAQRLAWSLRIARRRTELRDLKTQRRVDNKAYVLAVPNDHDFRRLAGCDALDGGCRVDWREGPATVDFGHQVSLDDPPFGGRRICEDFLDANAFGGLARRLPRELETPKSLRGRHAFLGDLRAREPLFKILEDIPRAEIDGRERQGFGLVVDRGPISCKKRVAHDAVEPLADDL